VIRSSSCGDFVLQFRGRSRFHMLECWLDSFHAPRTRGMPGCTGIDVIADGHRGEWSVHVRRSGAVRMSVEGLAFVSDRQAVAKYTERAAPLSAECHAAAARCAAAADQYGVPDGRTADSIGCFFDAYTALQGHYQATSSLYTAGAENALAAAVAACPQAPPHALSLLTCGDPSSLRSVRESLRWLELLLLGHRERWSEAERLAVIAQHAKSFGPVGELSDRLGSDPLELCMRRWERDASLPPDEIEARLAAHRIAIQGHLADRRDLAAGLRLAQEHLTIADNLAILAIERLAIREEFSLAAHTAYPAFSRVFGRVAGELGTGDGVRQLTRAEVVRVAAGETIATDTVVGRLRRGFCLVGESGKVCLAEADAERAASFYLGPGPAGGDACAGRLSGQIVSGGPSVTGRAIVLTRKMSRQEQVDAADALDAGDILVVAMTYPAIADACARAAGIVTDFGGLTCHAAVIARAVGVPCIVGTLEATSLLKTGDTVRLDIAKSQVVKVANG
jgi:phosphohistidine swiveling domain-containing protein